MTLRLKAKNLSFKAPKALRDSVRSSYKAACQSFAAMLSLYACLLRLPSLTQLSRSMIVMSIAPKAKTYSGKLVLREQHK
jgi:hypothetical protein